MEGKLLSQSGFHAPLNAPEVYFSFWDVAMWLLCNRDVATVILATDILATDILVTVILATYILAREITG